MFSNLNYAFLAPDVDRLFDSSGTFNGFIDPAMSTTLNIGANHVTSKNRAKLTLYGIKLKHELFYYSVAANWREWKNTNIDRSYKYGLELQDKYFLSNNLSASINYAYTQAIIDFEPTTGDELPQVSKHNVTFGLDYAPTSKSRVVLGHVYRSEAFSGEDFCNCLNQKQKAYNFTNLSYTYTHKTDNGKGCSTGGLAVPVKSNFLQKWKTPLSYTMDLGSKMMPSTHITSPETGTLELNSSSNL